MDRLRAKMWGQELVRFRDEWGRRDSTKGAVLEMVASLNSWCHANGMSHEQCVGSILNWVLPSRMKTEVLQKLQGATLYYPKTETVGGEEFVPVWGTLDDRFLITGSEKRGPSGWLPLSSFRSACDPSGWERLSLEPLAPGSPIDQAVSDGGHNSFGGASFLASSQSFSSFMVTPRKSPVGPSSPGDDSSSSGSGGSSSHESRGENRGHVLPSLPTSDSDLALPAGEQQYKLTLLYVFDAYKIYMPLSDLRDRIRAVGQFSNVGVQSVRGQLDVMLGQAGVAAFVATFRSSSATDWLKLKESFSGEVRSLQADAIYSMTRSLPADQKVELRKLAREQKTVFVTWRSFLDWMDAWASDRIDIVQTGSGAQAVMGGGSVNAIWGPGRGPNGSLGVAWGSVGASNGSVGAVGAPGVMSRHEIGVEIEKTVEKTLSRMFEERDKKGREREKEGEREREKEREREREGENAREREGEGEGERER